ncbi:MAG: pyridoxamine 5'-phosphate oxidase family protein [Cypionkella sp.]
MTTDADITATFWKHLRADRTVMLGLENAAPTTLRPMTAHLDSDSDEGPIWFFSSTSSAIVQGLAAQDRAVFSFVSKGHGVFAAVHGHLIHSTDRITIDRLWSPEVAAWHEGGQDDPALALLRFDPARAEIWCDGSGLLAGLSLLFSADPRDALKDKAAKVALT